MPYFSQDIADYWPFDPYNTGKRYNDIENLFIEFWPEDNKSTLFYPLALKDISRDGLAPAQFAAGWYLGATDSPSIDDSFITEVEACLTESEDLTNTLYDAMEYYIESEKRILKEKKVKDQMKGDDKMKEFIELLKPAMANCGQISDSFNELGEKFGELLPRAEWDDLDATRYSIDHQIELSSIIWAFTDMWSCQQYSNSGWYAGEVQSAYFKYGP